MRQGRKFKALILKSQGYIPANTFAMWDYNDGSITLAEMWSIIRRNIGISSSAEKGSLVKYSKYPRRGDAVILNYITNGKVDRVTYDSGVPEYVWVAYDDGEYEEYDFDDFIGKRVTIGGPNKWYIEY